jgi:hypothetical protein
MTSSGLEVRVDKGTAVQIATVGTPDIFQSLKIFK